MIGCSCLLVKWICVPRTGTQPGVVTFVVYSVAAHHPIPFYKIPGCRGGSCFSSVLSRLDGLSVKVPKVGAQPRRLTVPGRGLSEQSGWCRDRDKTLSETLPGDPKTSLSLTIIVVGTMMTLRPHLQNLSIHYFTPQREVVVGMKSADPEMGVVVWIAPWS